MKLRLSFSGEDLRASDGVYVIATQIHPAAGVAPTILGQTESIVATTSNNIDWTKSFVLDYEFGEELSIIVTIRTANRAISSALFDVGQILGNGGVLGKELKDNNGIVVVCVEECQCMGQLQLQIRGLQLKNMDGIGFGINKSDPFFEIQRQRVLATNNALAWDAVYRSKVIDNDLNPIFPEFFVDLDELIGSCSESGLATKKLRVVVYDYDKQDISRIDTSKCFPLTVGRSQQVTGKIVVAKAALIGVTAFEESAVATIEKVPLVESSKFLSDVDIPIVNATDELVAEPSDIVGSTFCNYIKGGCQLRVMVAIDTTATNGDPRQQSSLHFFNDSSLNAYEESLKAICSVLWLYDSDQKYPVYGFGAKRDGVINQCFPFSPDVEVDGVNGVLKVYRDTFRSGIVMSAPRDFSEVIRTTGKNTKQHNASGQSYSILLIFTNGSPADSDATVKVIQEVNDLPMSVVFIGIGNGEDLNGLDDMVKTYKGLGCRDNVRYVPYGADENHQNLAKLALHGIPKQLEEYFLGKNIHPEPLQVQNEIAVLPYSPLTDIEVPMVFNSTTGEATVTGGVNPATHDFSTKVTLAELRRLAQKINANPTFRRVKSNISANSIRKARYKINRLVGQNIL